tara:strand:+ start:282 stop:1139 length:858 start_codon:yes stop_codon:yes gene_type:complete
MKLSDELNDMQEAVLLCISTIRDGITLALDSEYKDNAIFRQTLRRLAHYQSSRSATISFLISHGKIWDAEIILRSFFEANIKIWYLCTLEGDEQAKALREFNETFSSVKANKRKHKTEVAIEVAKKSGSTFDENLLRNVGDETVFGVAEGNRKERKKVERNWSFSELLGALVKSDNQLLDFKYIRALEYQYSMQSHLIHADIVALDTITDQYNRSLSQITALNCAHVSRMFSDQVVIWRITSIALWGNLNSNNPNTEKEANAVKDALELSERFSEVFELSQQVDG